MNVHGIAWAWLLCSSCLFMPANANGDDQAKNVSGQRRSSTTSTNTNTRRKKQKHDSRTGYERDTQSSGIPFKPFDLEVSEDVDPSSVVRSVLSSLTSSLETRLSHLFAKTHSSSCRAKVATHFSYFLNAIGTERSGLPFASHKGYFDHPNSKRTCPEPYLDLKHLPKGMTFEKLLKRTYPNPNATSIQYYDYVPAHELKLLYGILMHRDAQSTLRLIRALEYNDNDENDHGGPNNHHRTLFVIHVDGKEDSDDAYEELTQYAKHRNHIYILPRHHSVRVNWGGFSMVQATLNILQYSFGLIPNDDGISRHHPLQFHKFIHLAASSYPIQSNTAIRNTLSSYPIDANFLYLIPKPLSPDPRAWHYFVECDDALHRIYRLTPLTRDMHGVEIYTSSQWFILGRDMTRYLAYHSTEEYGRGSSSFVYEYIQYAKHIVVADEHFFGTVLKHTEYCTTHHNDNFLFVQFDKWENELSSVNISTNERDNAQKCLMPDPNKCGRSPTILRKGDMFALELSGALFARKFSAEVDSDILDLIDEYRHEQEERLRRIAMGDDTDTKNVNTKFEGLGALIVAKETVNGTSTNPPLCLGLGSKGNKVRLVPCFQNAVVPTLSVGWETGAVIEEEVKPNGRWSVGPCSSDGSLRRRSDTAEMESLPGRYTPEGPRCEITQYGGPRHGRCLDIQGERMEPGGQLQVYPCAHKWHQMFGFGMGDGIGNTNETIVPSKGTVYGSVPEHILNTIQTKKSTMEDDDDRLPRHKQARHLCIGASGRGKVSYEPWDDDQGQVDLRAVDFVPKGYKNDETEEVPLLYLWNDKYLVTVPCSDRHATIEFLFVPFIEEVSKSDKNDERKDDDKGDRKAKKNDQGDESSYSAWDKGDVGGGLLEEL